VYCFVLFLHVRSGPPQIESDETTQPPRASQEAGSNSISQTSDLSRLEVRTCGSFFCRPTTTVSSVKLQKISDKLCNAIKVLWVYRPYRQMCPAPAQIKAVALSLHHILVRNALYNRFVHNFRAAPSQPVSRTPSRGPRSRMCLIPSFFVPFSVQNPRRSGAIPYHLQFEQKSSLFLPLPFAQRIVLFLL